MSSRLLSTSAPYFGHSGLLANFLPSAYTLDFGSHLSHAAMYSSRWRNWRNSHDDFIDHMSHVRDGLASTSSLLQVFADCAVIITLAGLGNNFIYALRPVTRQSDLAQKRVRMLALTSVVPLMILAFVEVCWGGVLDTRYVKAQKRLKEGYNVYNILRSIDKTRRTISMVHAASLVIHFIIAIVLVAQAAGVRHKYRGPGPATSVSLTFQSNYLLVTTPSN